MSVNEIDFSLPRMRETDNLAMAIYRHATSSSSENPAIVFEEKSLSYRDLASRAACLAARLTAHPAWNVEACTPPRVGILASRSSDACLAVIGACWAGATYVPISLKQPEAKIISIIEQCNLQAIITDNKGEELLTPSLLSKCPSIIVSAACECNDGAITPPILLDPWDLAYIIFTSGSTGNPKGVMIQMASIRHYLSSITELLGLRSDDRILETCDLNFDFSVHNMFSTWEVGACLHILPATRAMDAIKFARTTSVTVWNSVPSLLGFLRQIKALKENELPLLRLTVLGGEQLPLSTVQAWEKTAPLSTIFNLYGPTEATVFCCAQKLEKPIPKHPDRDVIAIGYPIAGNKTRIVDSAGNTVVRGFPGELLIGGVQTAAGYLGNDLLTSERFMAHDGDRWYRTGDIAIHDETGRLYCLGRIDNQVKVLGHRIELEEVDAHLRQLTSVDLVSSVAWPVIDGLARGIVGYIASDDVDTTSVIKAMRERVPSYMVPHRIIRKSQLPINASGKIDRRALSAMLDNEQSAHPTKV